MNRDYSGNIFDFLAESVWAALPEKAAEDIADCKRRALNRVKETIDWIIDEELRAMERHLENARRMRNEWHEPHVPNDPVNPPNPTSA
jgi:hypothetical protein